VLKRQQTAHPDPYSSIGGGQSSLQCPYEFLARFGGLMLMKMLLKRTYQSAH